MVNRPLLLRMLPDQLRIKLWSLLYRHRQGYWLPLYESASLRQAPAVDMELVPGDVISDSIAFTGLYEPLLTRRLVELARRGGTFVDIGANLGYFALVWAACKPSNVCIAFEPSPRNIDILRRNVNQNRLDRNIQVIPLAAGSESGTFHFDVGPPDQTGWGGLTLEENAGSIEVNVVRVDEVIPSDTPIELLKVDIEGAETWALMGCERLLKAGLVQEIWYEQNKPRMDALGIPLDAAQEYLRSVGYITTPRNDLADEVVEWSAVRASHTTRVSHRTMTANGSGLAC